MGFPPEYIDLVQPTHDSCHDSHSVSVVPKIRVRYVRTHLLGFQHVEG